MKNKKEYNGNFLSIIKFKVKGEQYLITVSESTINLMMGEAEELSARGGSQYLDNKGFKEIEINKLN